MFACYLEELNNFWALQGVSGAEIDRKDPAQKSGWGPLGGFEAMSRESAMLEMAPGSINAAAPRQPGRTLGRRCRWRRKSLTQTRASYRISAAWNRPAACGSHCWSAKIHAGGRSSL